MRADLVAPSDRLIASLQQHASPRHAQIRPSGGPGPLGPWPAGALAEVESVPLGQLRRAATATIGHFCDHGVPDERGGC